MWSYNHNNVAVRFLQLNAALCIHTENISDIVYNVFTLSE